MLRDKLSKSSVYNDESRFIGTDTPNRRVSVRENQDNAVVDNLCYHQVL